MMLNNFEQFDPSLVQKLDQSKAAMCCKVKSYIAQSHALSQDESNLSCMSAVFAT